MSLPPENVLFWSRACFLTRVFKRCLLVESRLFLATYWIGLTDGRLMSRFCSYRILPIRIVFDQRRSPHCGFGVAAVFRRGTHRMSLWWDPVTRLAGEST